MAFSTIQGSGGAPDSFVGTSGVDSITLINSAGNFFLGAQKANDFVSFTASGTAGGVIAGAQIRAGDGNDTILGFNGEAGGIFTNVNFNGNAGNDFIIFDAADQFFGSSIFGGQGDDSISTGTITSTLVNGNKGADAITTTGVATNSSIYGGQGNDTISFGFDLIGTLVSGDLGNDTIRATENRLVNNSSFFGGAGNDTIDLSSIISISTGAFIDGGADDDTLIGTYTADTILGGDGNDTITGGNGIDTITAGGGSNTIVYKGIDAVANANNVTGFDGGAVAGTFDVLQFGLTQLQNVGGGVAVVAGAATTDNTALVTAAITDNAAVTIAAAIDATGTTANQQIVVLAGGITGATATAAQLEAGLTASGLTGSGYLFIADTATSGRLFFDADFADGTGTTLLQVGTITGATLNTFGLGNLAIVA